MDLHLPSLILSELDFLHGYTDAIPLFVIGISVVFPQCKHHFPFPDLRQTLLEGS